MEKKSLKTVGKDGALVIVRPSKLAETGTTGIVAQGTYEGAKPNKFNATKNDYFIRDNTTNTLYIVNGTASLKSQLEQLDGTEGASVEVVYNGKKALKNGKSVHDFECFVRS